MRQLWVATERGFCSFSLRRIIPPLHSAFEKGSPRGVSGNHRCVCCRLEKENMCEAVENGVNYLRNEHCTERR